MTPVRLVEVATELARRQHGVVARRQLVDAGISRHTIDGHVRRGYLSRLHRGVYLVGSLAHHRTREMAAILATGSAACLSHRSAASLWKLMAPSASGFPVDVTVTRGKHLRPGIRLHRSRTLHPDDITMHERIPVTTPIRTLIDLAAVAKRRTLERAVAEGVALRLVDEGELARRVARHQGLPGIGHLRAAVGATGPALTRSAAEDSFLALVHRARVEAPQTNVVVGGHEVDFFWPTKRLAVEVDGRAFHISTRAFERDRRRDAELAARGIRVVRVTWKQLTKEPEAVLVRLGGALLAPAGPR